MLQRALVSSAIAAVAAATSLAYADDAVLYRMDVMGETPVLVPRIVNLPAGSTLVERAQKLFARLKKAKPQAYGQATLELAGERATELERSRIATVSLDPDRPRTSREVLAEIVHTFGALGITSVRTGSGQDAQLTTRGDIDSPAYTLTVPFWLGIPPAAFPGALVRLPGGELASAETLESRLRKGDPALVDSVMAVVGERRVARRLRGVRALGFAPANIAQPKLLGMLKDANARLRTAAVDGLGSHKGSEVVSALQAVLAEDRDEEVRIAAARALVESGDRGGAAAGIAFLLKSNDPDRKVAILSRLKGAALEGLADSLIPLLSDSSVKVRIVALTALAGNRDAKVLDAIADRLDKESVLEARDSAARALAQSGEARYVARGLAYDLGGKDEARAIAAAQQLGGMGADGREVLETTLKGNGAKPVRTAAAKALGRVADAASLPVLAEAASAGLKAAEKAANIILEALSAEALAKQMTEGAPNLRLLAVRAVKEGGGPAVQQALVAAAGDKDKQVRAAAGGGLGKVGGEGAVAALSTLLEDEVDVVRHAAAKSLGKLGDPAARPALIKLVKYGTIAVRRAVFRALAQLKGGPSREHIAPLLDSLYDDDAIVREFAIDTLAAADKKDRRILPVVRLQLKDQVVHVRKAAVRAVGMLGDEKIVSALEDALTDDDAAVRMVAVEALELVGGNRAAAVLEKHAGTEKDAAVVARAKEAIPKAKAKAE